MIGWIGSQPDEALACRAITDLGYVLSIDVHSDATPLSHDCEEIGLIQTCLDSWTGSLLEDKPSPPSKTIQLIGSICFHGEVIVWALCPNLAKEQAPPISFEDGHLYFIGEVGKIDGFSITRENMSLHGNGNMIAAPGKRTTARCGKRSGIPVVPLVVILQGVVENETPCMRGIGIRLCTYRWAACERGTRLRRHATLDCWACMNRSLARPSTWSKRSALGRHWQLEVREIDDSGSYSDKGE